MLTYLRCPVLNAAVLSRRDPARRLRWRAGGLLLQDQNSPEPEVSSFGGIAKDGRYRLDRRGIKRSRHSGTSQMASRFRESGAEEMTPETFGRTIQLFLVDGTPTGLRKATIHGWTGLTFVATGTTFAALTARPELDRTGIYILSGPDAEAVGGTRAYIGSANSVRERIKQSAASASSGKPRLPSPPAMMICPRAMSNIWRRG